MMTEKEARLVKEFQALKERNQQMEAQLELMRYCTATVIAPPAESLTRKTSKCCLLFRSHALSSLMCLPFILI